MPNLHSDVPGVFQIPPNPLFHCLTCEFLHLRRDLSVLSYLLFSFIYLCSDKGRQIARGTALGNHLILV